MLRIRSKRTLVFRRALFGASAVTGVWLLSALPLGCGGGGDSAQCGNNVLEEGESCDDGNTVDSDSCSNQCTIRQITTTALTIRWPINEGRFVSDPTATDACGDVSATHVSVRLTGGTTPTGGVPIDRTELFSCDLGQNKYLNTSQTPLYPGAYVVRVKLIQRVGATDAGPGGDVDLTTEKVLNVNVTESVQSTEKASFQISDFLTAHRGGLQFRTRWDQSLTCASATPPVATQRILLKTSGGTVVMKQTFDNPQTAANESLPTNGSATGNCVDANAAISQQVLDLEWGDYTLGVEGRTSTGQIAYCKVFPVFVGAQDGRLSTNPSIDLVVPGAASQVDGSLSVDGGVGATCF